MTARLSHASLLVTSNQRAVRFYAEMLGWRPVRQFIREDAEITWLGDNDRQGVELWLPLQPLPERYERHVAFVVPSLDDAIVRAKTHAIIEVRGGVRLGFLQDPDGHWVELIEGE